MESYPTTHTRRRRSPGEGSVYQIADGRWRGAITWTEPDGRRHRRTVSGRTSAEARENVDRLRASLRIGALAPSGTGSVADYLSGWIERDRQRVRPSTWRARELHVRAYLIPALGRLALARLSSADVERALAEFLRVGSPLASRRRPLSPLTVRHIRATLRRALKAAERAGLVARNAAADATPPYVPHRPVSYLSASDVGRLLDGTRDDPLGPLWALAVTTGLRRGELLGLSWSDVDEEAGTLTVRRSLAEAGEARWAMADPKSARSRRTLPLPALARGALDRQRVRQDAERAAAGTAWQDGAGLIFTDAVGRPMSPGLVTHAFTRARERLSLPPVSLHDLRHSAATLLLAEGVPLAVISELLGHAGIAITASHYAAVVPELRREAADAMDRALAHRAGGQVPTRPRDRRREGRA
jgi:integrase